MKNNRKTGVYVADGLTGIKHRLSVNQEGFNAATSATDLNLTGPEKWREHEETLRGNHLQVWKSTRDTYTVNRRDTPNFERAHLQMTVIIVRSGQHDTMFHWLNVICKTLK